jgi:hypothetical protein
MSKKVLLLMSILIIGTVIAACSRENQEKNTNLEIVENNKNLSEEPYLAKKDFLNEEFPLTSAGQLTKDSEKIDSQNNDTLELANSDSKQQKPVSVIDLKVGDKLGDFQVKEIVPLNTNLPFSSENFSLILNGETTITGELKLNDYYGTYFITPDPTEKLPQIVEKPSYNINFPGNDSFFSEGINNGRIKITFKGLTLESASEPYYFDGSQEIIKSEIIKNN